MGVTSSDVARGANGDAIAAVLRPLDPSEAYFFLMDHSSCMNFVTMVERGLPWSASVVRTALDELSAEDPVLRVGVALLGDPAQLYFVHVPGARVLFEERFVEESGWDGWVEVELQRKFADSESPLMRCAQLISPTSGKAALMLTTHHCISDGRAAADLVRRLVDRMMVQKEGVKRQDTAMEQMRGGMHGAFPARYRFQDDRAALRRMTSALLRDAAAGGLLTELPWFRPVTGPKRPRLIRLWFDAVQTASLAREAKRLCVSMHGLLCAAQLIAEAKLLNPSAAATLLLTCPVDMRPHVELAASSRHMQLYASMIFATYKVHGSLPIWELAEEVMSRTRAQLERGDAHYFYSSREAVKALEHPDSPEVFAQLLDEVPPGTVMSAIGKLPVIDSDPLVTSVSMAICSGARHAVFSAASSYNGRLVINMVYDEASILPGVGEALGAGLKDALRQVCMRACGVAP